MPEKKSTYTWDARTLRYRERATGKFIPHDDLFRAVDAVNRKAAHHMRALAGSLQRGSLSVRDFQRAMRVELKSLHAVNAAAGAGGWKQMTPADWGRVGARLRKEYAHLDSFARAVSSRRLPLASGRVPARAASYENNARLAYWEQFRLSASASGAEVLAVRRLGPVATEHCEGCRREAALPPRPIAQVKPLGGEECRWFCRCRIVVTGVRSK